MSDVLLDRSTHDLAPDAEIVVFLIGFRANRPWRVASWLPVFAAMPRMLRELSQQRELGLLAYRTLLGERGATVVQYWRSVDDLHAYAHATDKQHRPAWAAFNRAVRKRPGDVGIWHETYVVHASHAESFYGQMPITGLAAATGSAPITPRSDSAKKRLRAA